MREIDELLAVVRRLRAPNGCPWDIKQDFLSMRSSLVEEVHEFIDAVELNSPSSMKEELGDSLFNILFYSVLAEEKGFFTIASAADEVREKLIRRHPHVFGEAKADNADEALANWNASKDAEGKKHASILDRIPKSLPALSRSAELHKKAGSTGFDWSDATEVAAKIREELGELEEELRGQPKGRLSAEKSAAIEMEMGDLIFTCANLARFLEIDPERAARKSADKFEKRFKEMEKICAAQEKDFSKLALSEKEELWTKAKKLFP